MKTTTRNVTSMINGEMILKKYNVAHPKMPKNPDRSTNIFWSSIFTLSHPPREIESLYFFTYAITGTIITMDNASAIPEITS